MPEWQTKYPQGVPQEGSGELYMAREEEVKGKKVLKCPLCKSDIEFKMVVSVRQAVPEEEMLSLTCHVLHSGCTFSISETWYVRKEDATPTRSERQRSYNGE